MAYRCDNCDKGLLMGSKHRHKPGVAGGRWAQRAQAIKKIFHPNLHVARLPIRGQNVKYLLCTKCLRELKKKYPIYLKPSADDTKKHLAASL